jgi:hypothetical protein
MPWTTGAASSLTAPLGEPTDGSRRERRLGAGLLMVWPSSRRRAMTLLLPAGRLRCSKSRTSWLHLPQAVPTLRQREISLRVHKPPRMASRSWFSVTPLQMQTYMNRPIRSCLSIRQASFMPLPPGRLPCMSVRAICGLRSVSRHLCHLLHVPSEAGHFVVNATKVASPVASSRPLPPAAAVTGRVLAGLRAPWGSAGQYSPFWRIPVNAGFPEGFLFKTRQTKPSAYSTATPYKTRPWNLTA